MAVDRHDFRALPSLLTIDEVAEFLRVSNTSVYRLVERRELPFCRVGRGLRFSRKDLESYLGSRRVGSAASDDNTYECTQDPGAGTCQ
jgi:excisionase family DNA binding protein